MRSFLVVANQTLGGSELAETIDERLRSGPARFHVVVPLSPVQHRLTWDEEESRIAAHERLDAILARLRARGAEAGGEIGDRDPVEAANDALRAFPADEIILSTLPPGLSRWLGQDVPSRLRAAVRVPVVVITQRERVDAGA